MDGWMDGGREGGREGQWARGLFEIIVAFLIIIIIVIIVNNNKIIIIMMKCPLPPINLRQLRLDRHLLPFPPP